MKELLILFAVIAGGGFLYQIYKKMGEKKLTAISRRKIRK